MEIFIQQIHLKDWYKQLGQRCDLLSSDRKPRFRTLRWSLNIFFARGSGMLNSGFIWSFCIFFDVDDTSESTIFNWILCINDNNINKLPCLDYPDYPSSLDSNNLLLATSRMPSNCGGYNCRATFYIYNISENVIIFR